MSERKPRVINPPDRIFLCVGELLHDDDFKELDEVTWCTAPQEDSDVEYRLVRPSRHRKRDALTAGGHDGRTE